MNDMTSVIIPKSDQLNADDLISGPRTITISEVYISPGTEQPVTIRFEGDEGRPWKPCKSMSRLMVAAWGPDANKYKGKSLTLYRDPKVKWGGMEVGGIRVSHMTDLPEDKVSNGRMVVQLTETRGKRSPCVVQPLTSAPKPRQDAAANWAGAYVSKVSEAPDADALEAFVSEKASKLAELEGKRPELHAECIAAVEQRRSDFSTFAVEDDLPAWHEPIEAMKARIDAASDADTLAKIRAEFDQHAGALPDEVRADMVQRFETMSRALERQS